MSDETMCPKCKGDAPKKLLLIGRPWCVEKDGDPRLKFYSDLRVDWVESEARGKYPLEQFVEGYYCYKCDHGFVLDEIVENQYGFGNNNKI